MKSPHGPRMSSPLPCELPIVAAPMAGGPSTPELAAAVTEAGGLGTVAGGYLTADGLRAELARARAGTAGPLAVNLFVPSAPGAAVRSDAASDAVHAIDAYAASLRPEAARFGVELGAPEWDDDHYPDKLEVALSSDVVLLSFTFGCPPAAIVARARSTGKAVAVTVTSHAEAIRAADAGADLLIVQGTEAGGHQGGAATAAPNRTPLRELLARLRTDPGLPLVGAGGVMTADDVRAALAAGAVAVQVGTALLCAPEAGTSGLHRGALREPGFTETMLTRAYSGRWARGLANRFAREHADAPEGYPQIHHLTAPLRAAARARGDTEVPNLWAGTGWREIVERPAAETVRALAG